MGPYCETLQQETQHMGPSWRRFDKISKSVKDTWQEKLLTLLYFIRKKAKLNNELENIIVFMFINIFLLPFSLIKLLVLLANIFN